MAYSYQEQRSRLFSEEGQRLYIGFRDRALMLLKQAGAVRMQELMRLPVGIGSADGWDILACADRMIELGDMREITGPNVAGQHRVFVSARHDD
jgi:hypothetical protein